MNETLKVFSLYGNVILPEARGNGVSTSLLSVCLLYTKKRVMVTGAMICAAKSDEGSKLHVPFCEPKYSVPSLSNREAPSIKSPKGMPSR